jgi:hypothetical protein
MELTETPVLTKKQQRIALSGKKKKKRDHTVFASPYSPYWLVYQGMIFVHLFAFLHVLHS